MTEKKLDLRYARSLIEASLDPLFTISMEGKITDVNKATLDVTGFSRDEIIYTNFADYFTDKLQAEEMYRDVFENGFVFDFPLVIKDHKLTDVLVNGSVYKNDAGVLQGAVVVARDMTNQKQFEKELIEAKVIAEKAAKKAKHEMKKAEAAVLIAENAVKSKQQFLSNMSHEIRTPMNAIIGFTKVVLKTELSAKQREYLAAIKISGDSLIVLINDILDLAKVDAGKIEFEQTPFKMAFSIAAMLHLFETKIQEKNLQLVRLYDVSIPEVLIGDPVRLHQIILNLMSNAVKFTNSGSITAKVQLIEETDSDVTIEFSISDTGIGISNDRIASVFENFQQATSETSRLYGGTGLGLAIVKQLVESQGGKVTVSSEEHLGSEFSFTLTFLKSTDDVVNVEEQVMLEQERLSISVLVVEDIALNQLLMKTILDEFGFESDIASNGLIALEKLKSKTYDVVLMDLQMPEMNGFEATDYIRNVMNSTVPIIALTADVTTADLKRCKTVGMDDYLAKPIDEELLYSKILGIIKKKKIQLEAVPEVAPVLVRYTNLEYLMKRTNSNPNLMSEMISLYLEQTPTLISEMRRSFDAGEWSALQAVIHKMIPSFSIMGISSDFEMIARQINDFAEAQKAQNEIQPLVAQLESICLKSCEELKEELNELMRSKSH